MTGAQFLAWFLQQPTVYCAKCNTTNELNPPKWWRGNCWHYPVPKVTP